MKYIASILFIVIICFAIKSAQLTGTQSAMIVPRPAMSNDWSSFELKDTRVEKCVILGDTMTFDAASETRCDDLYKYYHIIGYGQIAGCKDMVYLYRLNLKNRFVTISELLAIHKELKKGE